MGLGDPVSYSSGDPDTVIHPFYRICKYLSRYLTQYHEMTDCNAFSPSTSCSGKGYCVNTGNDNICICNKNWSSMGWFAVKFGQDCDIYIPSIMVIASLSLFVCTCSLIYEIYYFTM